MPDQSRRYVGTNRLWALEDAQAVLRRAGFSPRVTGRANDFPFSAVAVNPKMNSCYPPPRAIQPRQSSKALRFVPPNERQSSAKAFLVDRQARLCAAVLRLPFSARLHPR